MNIHELLNKLDEAYYYVYNPQEEKEEGIRPEERRPYSSEELRNIFIGSLSTKGNFIAELRKDIDNMSDEWVAEFIRVKNADVVEKVSE